MKKAYLLLFLVVSFMMVFAGDTIKVLRIHYNGGYTDIPLAQIYNITHSEYDENDVQQPNVVTSVIWTADNQYKFPIEKIESAEVVEKELEGEELYAEVTTDLHNFLSTHEGVTIEEIQAQLKKYPSNVTSYVENNILYINIDGYNYMCDLYGVTLNDFIQDEIINETYINNLINEINSALHWNNMNARAQAKNEGLVTRSDQKITLRKKKVLLWNPWESSAFRNIPLGLSTNDFDSFVALGNLKSFSNYDIVIMDCHGTPNGEVMVPRNRFTSELSGFKLREDYDKGSVGSGPSYKETWVLKESLLNKLISNDLSETMVWTAMCHANADASVLKRILRSRNVAAFAGANNKVANYVVQGKFSSFVAEFYKNASAADAAKEAFANENVSSNKISSDYVYVNSEHETIRGTYSFEYYKDISYEPLVTAMNAVDNKPVASITMPYNLADAVMASRRRTTSTSSISAGFWFKNKLTNKVTEQEINKSTTTLNNRYDYKKIISRIELLGDTKDIESGTYYYRTYLKIDGKKEYSDAIFEFTKIGGNVETLEAPYAKADVAQLYGIFNCSKPIEEAGFYVGSSQELSEYLKFTVSQAAGMSSGYFYNYVTGAHPSDTYYYKAYVIVDGEIYFGETLPLKTSWTIDGEIKDYKTKTAKYIVDDEGEYVAFNVNMNYTAPLMSTRTEEWGVYIDNYNKKGDKYYYSSPSINLSEDTRDITIEVDKSWFDQKNTSNFQAIRNLKMGVYKIVQYDNGKEIYYSEPQDIRLVYEEQPSATFKTANLVSTSSATNEYGTEYWQTVLSGKYEINGSFWLDKIDLVIFRGDADDKVGTWKIEGDGLHDYKFTYSYSKEHTSIDLAFRFDMILTNGSRVPSTNGVRLTGTNKVTGISITNTTRSVDSSPSHTSSVNAGELRLSSVSKRSINQSSYYYEKSDGGHVESESMRTRAQSPSGNLNTIKTLKQGIIKHDQ